MKEELQNKLVEILASMQSTVGQAKDFTLSQLPDIAQSYLLFGRVTESLQIAASLALLCVAAWAGYKCFVWGKEGSEDADGWEAFVIVIGGFSGGIGGISFMLNISEFLLVWLAPKVWLIQEIAKLVK